MELARSYASMIGLLWLLSKDETKSHRERAFRRCEHQVLQFGFGFHTKKHENLTNVNAFSSFIFDFCCLFQSLSPRASKTMVCQREKGQAIKRQKGTLSPLDDLIPWPRFHQPLRQGEGSTGRCGSQTSWIQRRWAVVGERRKVREVGMFFSENLVISAKKCHFLPESVEMVETEWIDKVFFCELCWMLHVYNNIYHISWYILFMCGVFWDYWLWILDKSFGLAASMLYCNQGSSIIFPDHFFEGIHVIYHTKPSIFTSLYGQQLSTQDKDIEHYWVASSDIGTIDHKPQSSGHPIPTIFIHFQLWHAKSFCISRALG